MHESFRVRIMLTCKAFTVLGVPASFVHPDTYSYVSFGGSSENTNLHRTTLVILWAESAFIEYLNSCSFVHKLRAICNRPSANSFILSNQGCLLTKPSFLVSTFAVLNNNSLHLEHSLHAQESCITEEILRAIK